MINNHNIIHWVDLLSPIEPSFVCSIVLRFVDFDYCATQCNLGTFVWWCPTQVFFSGPLDLIFNHRFIDAKCNENDIITNCTFSTNSIKKNHTCKHYHVSYTNWIVESIAKGLILKDTLSKCDEHLENTHVPLTPKP